MPCTIIDIGNPLVLFMQLFPDEEEKGTLNDESLSLIRFHVQEQLMNRHYKHLIMDLKGVRVLDSKIIAKILMAFEKSTNMHCKIHIINLKEDLLEKMKSLNLVKIIPSYSVAETYEDVMHQILSKDFDEDFNEFLKNISFEKNSDVKEEISNSEINKILESDNINTTIEDAIAGNETQETATALLNNPLATTDSLLEDAADIMSQEPQKMTQEIISDEEKIDTALNEESQFATYEEELIRLEEEEKEKEKETFTSF